MAAAPSAPLANPLRKGTLVRCPRCGHEGEAWLWELKRVPEHAQHTAPCYKCRRCGHLFALRD